MADDKKSQLNLDEIDFLNLVLLLGNTATIELGEKAAKGAEKKASNLPRARQFINMLGILEKKTEGRRTNQEETVLKSLLSDLQEKYVKAAGLDKADPDIAVLSRLAAQAYGKQKPK